MRQAKDRGNFEDRKAQSIQRRESEEKLEREAVLKAQEKFKTRGNDLLSKLV